MHNHHIEIVGESGHIYPINAEEIRARCKSYLAAHGNPDGSRETCGGKYFSRRRHLSNAPNTEVCGGGADTKKGIE
jgi:hypothetical protein